MSCLLCFKVRHSTKWILFQRHFTFSPEVGVTVRVAGRVKDMLIGVTLGITTGGVSMGIIVVSDSEVGASAAIGTLVVGIAIAKGVTVMSHPSGVNKEGEISASATGKAVVVSSASLFWRSLRKVDKLQLSVNRPQLC
jgi:hypothetical protein